MTNDIIILTCQDGVVISPPLDEFLQWAFPDTDEEDLNDYVAHFVPQDLIVCPANERFYDTGFVAGRSVRSNFAPPTVYDTHDLREKGTKATSRYPSGTIVAIYRGRLLAGQPTSYSLDVPHPPRGTQEGHMQIDGVTCCETRATPHRINHTEPTNPACNLQLKWLKLAFESTQVVYVPCLVALKMIRAGQTLYFDYQDPPFAEIAPTEASESVVGDDTYRVGTRQASHVAADRRHTDDIEDDDDEDDTMLPEVDLRIAPKPKQRYTRVDTLTFNGFTPCRVDRGSIRVTGWPYSLASEKKVGRSVVVRPGVMFISDSGSSLMRIIDYQLTMVDPPASIMNDYSGYLCVRCDIAPANTTQTIMMIKKMHLLQAAVFTKNVLAPIGGMIFGVPAKIVIHCSATARRSILAFLYTIPLVRSTQNDRMMSGWVCSVVSSVDYVSPKAKSWILVTELPEDDLMKKLKTPGLPADAFDPKTPDVSVSISNEEAKQLEHSWGHGNMVLHSCLAYYETIRPEALINKHYVTEEVGNERLITFVDVNRPPSPIVPVEQNGTPARFVAGSMVVEEPRDT